MNIQTRQTETAVTISASGKIDAMTAPAFESAITDLMDESNLKMILDLGGVDYISRAGLRVILASAKFFKGTRAA